MGSATPTGAREKPCNRCEVVFPAALLTFQAGGSDPVNLCAPCHEEVARSWNKVIPSRATRYERVYGLTLEEHAVLFVRQGGRCAICRTAEVALVVDHHHGDGHVRGLLCNQCNIAIGLLRDDATVALAAASYLETR